MLSDRFKYDGKESITLNEVQIATKRVLTDKLKEHYKYERVKCICGNDEFEILAEKDRYGLPVETVICKKCGLMMTNPRMTEKSYNEFYDKEYRPLYVGKEIPNNNFFCEQYHHGIQIMNYLSNSNVKEYKSVLEIGCGAGGILKAFKETGVNVLGIDLGSEYINYGKDNGLNLVSCNSLELLECYEGKFDIIILSHVMEHFLDIYSELNTIRKLISDRGVIYIELPGIKNLHFSYECDLLKYLQNAHTYHFNLDTLKQVMRINGFEFICGDEYIHSIFRKSNLKDNVIYNYYNDTKKYLIDLEKNRFNYREQYEKLIIKEANEHKEKRFKIVKETIENYEDNTVVLYGIGNHTKILLDYIGDTNKILGLLDRNEDEIGEKYYGYEVLRLDKIINNIKSIVISSDIYQEEIYKRIRYLENLQIDVVKIY